MNCAQTCSSFSAVQNQTEENPSPGSPLPLHDSPPYCPSHKLYDLQPCPTICHVWKPEVSCAGEEKRGDLWVFPGFSLSGRSQMWGWGSIDGAVVKSVGSNRFGPVGYNQQGGLYGLVAGLLDSCPFWFLSVSIRPCGYYCVDLLFDSLPSVWSDVALLFLTLSVWVCAPSCLCFVSKNLWNRIIKMNRSVVFAETCSFKWEKITFKKKKKQLHMTHRENKQGLFPSSSPTPCECIVSKCYWYQPSIYIVFI